jgi:hypothetical protein
MITFTRDEAQKLLDTLAEAIDAQQWELDNHIKTYGEWYRPKRVEYMRDALANTLRTVEILSHKLNTPQREPITPSGGGGSGEPTVDGWPLWSGLPQQKKPVVDKSMAKRIATQLGWEPKREWVDLTDKEIGEIFRAGWSNNMDFARAIQAKLKEKNNG